MNHFHLAVGLLEREISEVLRAPEPIPDPAANDAQPAQAPDLIPSEAPASEAPASGAPTTTPVNSQF